MKGGAIIKRSRKIAVACALATTILMVSVCPVFASSQTVYGSIGDYSCSGKTTCYTVDDGGKATTTFEVAPLYISADVSVRTYSADFSRCATTTGHAASYSNRSVTATAKRYLLYPHLDSAKGVYFIGCLDGEWERVGSWVGVS